MANSEDKTYENIESPYDSLLNRGDTIPSSESASLSSMGSTSISSPTEMGSGTIDGSSLGDIYFSNFIKSRNYQPKSQGIYLDGKTGYGELQLGNIAGWNFTNSELTSGSVSIQSAAERILMGSATAPLTGTGIFLGKDSSDYEFRAGNPSADYIHWNGTSLTIVGSITATSGTIGGWTIGANSIIAGSGAATVGLDSTVTVGDDVRIYAGSATPSSAPFRVTESGALTTSNITITGIQSGSSLDGQYMLANSIGSASANLALQQWTQTCTFYITATTTVAWSSGTFTLSDGTSYSISAGNTGVMAVRTYIYLDIAVSTTTYQVSTTASDTIGNGKKLVATAINGATEPEFMVYDGKGSLNINASSIAAGTITSNEIATNTITAGKMNVTTLSAISANLGSITAGDITGVTITGGTMQTASSGPRIILQGSDNTLYLKDSSGNNLVIFGSSSSQTMDIKPVSGLTSGLLITNQGAGNQTGRMLDVNIINSGSTAVTGYFSNAGSGSAIQAVATGTGKALIITSGTADAIEVTTGGAGSRIFIDHNYSSDGLIDIDINANDANNTIAIKMNVANAGAGEKYAFHFEGSEYDGTKTGVSGLTGVIRIQCSDGEAFIPVYGTAT